MTVYQFLSMHLTFRSWGDTMWTYNNTCMNTNFRYKDRKWGYRMKQESSSENWFQRVTERKGGIKTKQKLKHEACTWRGACWREIYRCSGPSPDWTYKKVEEIKKVRNLTLVNKQQVRTDWFISIFSCHLPLFFCPRNLSVRAAVTSSNPLF